MKINEQSIKKQDNFNTEKSAQENVTSQGVTEKVEDGHPWAEGEAVMGNGMTVGNGDQGLRVLLATAGIWLFSEKWGLLGVLSKLLTRRVDVRNSPGSGE